MKTIQCPSCGGSATNSQNCEFCGSLFVRASAVGYDAKALFENSEIDVCLNGLKEALDQNISNQNKFRKTSYQVGTNFFKSKEDFENDNTNYLAGVWNRDYKKDPLRGEISIVFEVSMLKEKQKLLMSQMEEFKLIDDTDADGLWQIHFGGDTAGAAFLLSRILNKAFNIDFHENLFFHQQAYSNTPPHNDLLNDSNSNKKSDSCFIATATMGDFDHPLVRDLRDFRDEWILKQPWGENFVNWYYRYGSKAAKLIEDSYLIKRISFVTIVKPLHIITKILKDTK